MWKHELPPDRDGLADIKVLVDFGSLGMPSDDRGDQMAVPHKKPRKSPKHPSPQCSAEHKATHKACSHVRIFVEHAIGGMKRYNILVHSFRNHTEHFEDDVIGICAGLWNVPSLIPTTTAVLDMLIFPAYAASNGSDHHQEAEDVPGTANRRRGVLQPAV